MTPAETLAPPPAHPPMSDEVARITEAVARAQRAAIERHRRLGEPVVVWRDGGIVEEVPAAPPAPDDR